MTTSCYSLPLVATHCHSLYHSLSLIVRLVVTLYTTRSQSLSLLVPLVVTRFHLLSHDLPFVCPFINDRSGPLYLLFKKFNTVCGGDKELLSR